MRDFKLSISALFLLTIGLSCNKVIDLKLGNVAGQLVIEGNVTNVFGTQVIKLSRNVAFTSTNTYPAVAGATVMVTDNKGNTFPFIEGPAGTYLAQSMQGRTNTIYTMTVLTNGVTYAASSQMPQAVALDSITSRPSDFSNNVNKREISVDFHDRLGVANQYRFILTVNGVQVKRVFAFNDQFSDGKIISADLFENDIDIFPGDTVTVEMQCIDNNIYTYWFALMQQGDPGFGITPANPPTNITPTTLGYFSAHTTQTKSIIVK